MNGSRLRAALRSCLRSRLATALPRRKRSRSQPVSAAVGHICAESDSAAASSNGLNLEIVYTQGSSEIYRQ